MGCSECFGRLKRDLYVAEQRICSLEFEKKLLLDRLYEIDPVAKELEV